MAVKDDIAIGPDRWIIRNDFDFKNSTPYSIDDLFEPTWPLWEKLEIECVAECCGINAFDFYPETILDAGQKLNKIDILMQMRKMKMKLEHMTEPVIVVSKLNQLFERAVFISLIGHIITTLEQAA